MHVASVNIARPRLVVHHGKSYSTAINKQPQLTPVEVTELGLTGDKSADPVHHGGPYQAICVYPHEHYADVAAELGVDELPVPSFGENLTTVGLIESELCIGDHLRIGSDLVAAITKPREPCSKLARKHDSPQLGSYIFRTAFTGFYMRVVTPGFVSADDPIELINRPHEGLTVALTMRALFAPDAEPDLIARYADCESLTPGWRDRARKRLDKLQT